jgi:Amt family ammonium transporter
MRAAKVFGLAVLTLLLAAPRSLLAQPTGATPSVAELAAKVAQMEAYINNADPKAGYTAGPGHNGFMMVAAALVLFMTLPGLALFYGGLVRRKNVLSVLAQCFGCAGLVTILWYLAGYSLAFSHGSAIVGGFSFAFLKGVGAAPNTDFAYWVSQSVYCMYQLMFAIITPALIVGAIAERMKYSAVMLFILLWMFVVYFPFAHMAWGPDGLMNGVWNPHAAIKAIDFAGGTVVHMTSGWSALVLCLILGKRTGFGQRAFLPHSMVLTMVGTGMLWVGWYGFNAGSAVAADGIAANAFMTTTIAAALAASTWPALEWVTRRKPTVLGFCSGAVAGLVVITPAAGFVSAGGAVIIGILAGVVPFLACSKLKSMFNYDDALDTFGVHGVGGTLGAFVTGLFATHDVNANLATNLKDVVGHTLWLEQIKAILLTAVWSVAATAVIALVVKAVLGLRADRDTEQAGLDQADHGEVAYHFEEAGS